MRKFFLTSSLAILLSNTAIASSDLNVDQLKRETIHSFVSGGWSFVDLSAAPSTDLVTLSHPAPCLQFATINGKTGCVRRPFRIDQKPSGSLEPLFVEYSFCLIDVSENQTPPRINVHWQSSSYFVKLPENQCVNGTGFKESSIVLESPEKDVFLPTDNGVLVFYKFIDQFVPLNDSYPRTTGAAAGQIGGTVLRSFGTSSDSK